MLNFSGTLLSVSDMKTSREFYEQVLDQTVIMDLGVHVTYQNGLSLQSNYEELVGVPLPSVQKSNNFQIYFETDDLDSIMKKIKNTGNIEFVHDIKEYPWGQQVFRIYDPDKHIVEVAEAMECVAKRLLKQGVSVEETAQKTMYPVEMIKQWAAVL